MSPQTESIVIYSKPSCPYCTSAKDLLEGKGLAYAERDIEASPAYKAEWETFGRSTVPQIIIDGQHLGGCDDLYALAAIGGI